MVETPSAMIPLGTQAPKFSLPDTVSGEILSLDELRANQATVVMFICNHCPYVKHIQTGLVQLVNDYIPEGIAFIAINSNDVTSYPDDSPEKMKELAERMKFPFPYLYDESQEVARAYNAACTPDFYIFDGEMKLVYRGQFDDSRPNSGIPITGKDIRSALDRVLAGEPVDPHQKPSLGCNIKWKI
ncbi:MAG: thioredoxin family protein [Anaerolineales bacterium]|jgi:peroxiredoxin